MNLTVLEDILFYNSLQTKYRSGNRNPLQLILTRDLITGHMGTLLITGL